MDFSFERINLSCLRNCDASGGRKSTEFKEFSEAWGLTTDRPTEQPLDRRHCIKFIWFFFSICQKFRIERRRRLPSEKFRLPYPTKYFLSPPVVLLSFISRFAPSRYQIDSNTTESQKKIG